MPVRTERLLLRRYVQEQDPPMSPVDENTSHSAVLRVARGCVHVYFAYDVARGIDLDEAERKIHAVTERARVHQKRLAPRYFEYRPAPLRTAIEIEPVAVGAFRSVAALDAVLFDFGAVSVAYRFPISGRLADLITLSEDLYDHKELAADSRRKVEDLLRTIEPALTHPSLGTLVETYLVFEVERFDDSRPVADSLSTHVAIVAQLLRAEHDALSNEEIADATARRLSLGEGDVAIIDWNAALVCDTEAEDVLFVLEFANVELLEMRFLDDRLDAALDQAYEVLARTSWVRNLWPGSLGEDLRIVGRLQVDNAALFEGVNNALKLIGDQYLARVYRTATECFHLPEWDATVLRKLDTLESIHEKLSAQATSFRLEILEWIIVILIAISIVIPFVPGVSAH